MWIILIAGNHVTAVLDKNIRPLPVIKVKRIIVCTRTVHNLRGVIVAVKGSKHKAASINNRRLSGSFKSGNTDGT